MGREIAKTNEPVKRSGSLVNSNWTELAKTAETNPLALLPSECRTAVSRLWMVNSHVLQSSLALCSTLRIYMDEHSLSAEGVVRVCEKMMKPAKRAAQRGSWDVIADLSALVDDEIKSGRAREECEGRRTESEAFQSLNLNAADLFLKLSEK